MKRRKYFRPTEEEDVDKPRMCRCRESSNSGTKTISVMMIHSVVRCSFVVVCLFLLKEEN